MRTEDFYTDDVGRKVARDEATRVERRVYAASGELIKREFYALVPEGLDDRERAIERETSPIAKKAQGAATG